jgi:hypothetical protein
MFFRDGEYLQIVDRQADGRSVGVYLGGRASIRLSGPERVRGTTRAIFG